MSLRGAGRSASIIACGLVLVSGWGSSATRAQGAIDVVWVSGPIYMFAGAGGNVTASIGSDGVLLVDSGEEAMSAAVLDAIRGVQRQLADAVRPTPRGGGAEGRSTVVEARSRLAPPKPVRYIINTSAAPEHTGGNQRLSTSGVTFTGGNVAGQLSDAGEGAAIYAHEQVMRRMVDLDLPFAMLPTSTYYQDHTKLSHFFNGEGIRMVHMPAARSDGDTIVQFTRSDVIATGDLFSQTGYPVIDLGAGGSIDGILEALNDILDMAIPEFRTEGGTMIVPGHGRLSDSADVGYYRDMLTIVRDNVRTMMDRGLTLAQVKAARPTRAYDRRFGSDSGPWTTDMFVEAVYRSLAGTP
jgi:glyoxylase-like metal-dependent hydrolase (beta-lactamase superfamily II)